MKRRILSFALTIAMLFSLLSVTALAQSGTTSVQDNGDTIVLTAQNYVITIEKAGFRYGFSKPDGTEIIGAHSLSGISFGKSGGTSYPVVSTKYQGTTGNVASFLVTNQQGATADVKIHLFDTYARYEILPIESESPEEEAPSATPTLGATSLLVKGSQSKDTATVWKLKDGILPTNDYTVQATLKLPQAGTASAGIYSHYNASNAFHLFFIKSGSVSLKRLNTDGSSLELPVSTPINIKTDTWYTLKLVSEGNRLRGYVNGQLVVEATDSGAGAQQLTGAAGLRTDKMDLYLDDFKVTSNDGKTVYYKNDFEDGTAGDYTQNLECAMGSKLLEMYNNPPTDKYLQLVGNPTASAVTGETGWTGYTVSAEMAFAIGDEETSNGLLFGYQDRDNYYGFRFGAAETLSLYKMTDGTERLLASGTMPYSFDKVYLLKASMNDGVLTCYVDGVQKLTANDSTFASGKAGILTAVTTSKTDNFKVTDSSGDLFSATFDDGSLADWSITGSGKITDGTEEPPVIDPDTEIRYYTIDARLAGGIAYLYGLGDYGALGNTSGTVRETSNVAGVNRMNAGTFTNKDSVARFISNFTIAPQLGFAQVLFETDDKRVSYTADQTLLGAYKTQKVDGLYYFFGDMQQIYGDYKTVRNTAGYVDTKPHYEMFGLGWEAFGSLGWNAYQSSVMSTLTDYLKSGYDITWGVVGSGFWTGDRKALEGTTTSFGMWDDTADPAGRTDGLPNPRFPDPDGLKQFFKDNDLKLLLGLRNHLKLPDSYEGVTYGGKWDESVDGRFVFEALDNGYFLKNDDGSLYQVNAKYPTGGIEPRGPVGIIDAENPEAVKWFSDHADLWGVDGFKEDCMMLQTTHNDDNWNNLLQYMVEEKDNLIIVRNASYCLPGDVLRINDANYGTNNASFNNSPDRMVINSLAYAASGQSNVYPDIIGGTGANINDASQQNYIVRNAYFAALCPSQSVGINVLKMNNQERKDAAFKAINWHSTYAPYIYDAALKSFETGYPTSMTPLYIAYPEDTATYNMINSTNRMYEWMLGESILATPLFGTDHQSATSRDVYLPEGKWIQYDTGEVFVGPITLKDREAPIDQMPAFVGGKGILVGEDMENKGNYFIEVFPIAEKGSVYDYTFIDGTTRSAVAANMDGFNPASLVVTDTTDNKTVEFTVNEVNRAVRFDYEPGHSYKLTGGLSEGKPLALNAACDNIFVGDNALDSLQLTLVMDDFTRLDDLTGYELSYQPEDASFLSLEAGKLVALKAGTTRFEVTVSKDGDSISAWVSVTIKTRAIDITAPASGSTLYSGRFVARGQLLDVDGAEVFLTARESDQVLYTAIVTTENSAFTALFSGVEDGEYLLHAKESPGGTAKVIVPIAVDSSAIILYDDFDGASNLHWDKSVAGASAAVDESKSALVGVATTADGKIASVITTAGEPISGEYTVKTTMTFRGGTASAGLVFGYEDENNFFHVRLDKSNAGGKAQLYQFVDGKATKAEPEGSLSCADNRPYTLMAKVSGKTVQYYLDDKLITEKTYDKDVVGKVGFRIYNVAADFSEILVTTNSQEKAAVTARYLDENGEPLIEAVSAQKLVGSAYHTQAKGIDGYILVETPANVSGIVPQAGVEVVYRYRAKIAVTGVSLDKTKASLYSNASPGTVQLTAAVAPADADVQDVTWSSDHPEVATVDENGLVTAVANGTASITVSTAEGSYTAVCTVSVITYSSPYVPPTTGNTSDGTVTTTVTLPDGSVLVTVKKPDGTIITTETSANKVVTKTTAAPDGTISAEITLPIGAERATVTIPVAQPTPGMVAVAVGADGKETVLPFSLVNENGVRLTADSGLTVRIEDRGQAFQDVASSAWYGDSVRFVTARELFQGTGAEAFAPDLPMNRAMLLTVLYRLDGQKYGTDGATWYSAAADWAMEVGISDGTNLDAAISREQLAVILYRYAGVQETEHTVPTRSDAGEVSGWASEAMAWAVETGILSGKPDGRLAPQDSASRAEVAAMLMRFVRVMVG